MPFDNNFMLLLLQHGFDKKWHSLTIQLDYFWTFLIDSPNDLRGSKVVSNRSIAVYLWHTCGEIPKLETFSCDFPGNQILPKLTY